MTIVEIDDGRDPSGVDRPRASDTDRRLDGPRIGWTALAIVVLPVWVAVVRNGLHGLFPFSDAALTVGRANDVFAGPFPLVGMPAAAATTDGLQPYFPGAWQLYTLAVPSRLFGDVWGPLIAMGLLNTAWLLLAGWLLLRRLRMPEALAGIAVLAVLSWSVGSGFLVTPVPMDMVLIPTAAFLVAVWAVADGDLLALPVLAVVGNFLWLDHLVLVVTVPLVALCAPIGLWRRVRRLRMSDPDAWPAYRRRLVWSSGVAAAITVIMWIPTLVQQVTVQPGNLRVLASSAGADRPIIGSWTGALHDVISVVARPPFWLRGSLEAAPYLRRPLGGMAFGALSWLDVVLVVIVVAVLVGSAVSASRRDDGTGLRLLVVAAVALVVAVITTYSAPTYLGPPTGYLRSVWATATFVWLAVVVNAVRAWGHRSPRGVVAVSALVIVAASVANLPTASFGYDADRRTQDVVRSMNATVVPRLQGDGPVMVATGIDPASHTFGAALTLALRDADLGYCVPDRELLSDGSRPACPDEVASVVRVEVTADPSKAFDGEVLVREQVLSAADRAELARLDARIDEWLGGDGALTMTPAAERRLDDWLTGDQKEAIRALSVETDRAVSATRTDPIFRALVNLWFRSDTVKSRQLFVDQPLRGPEWRRWLDLSAANRTLVVTRSAKG